MDHFKNEFLKLKIQGKTDNEIRLALGLSWHRFREFKKEHDLKKDNYFALYRGDEFLAHGPIQEIGWRFNLKPSSIRMLAVPSYHERAARATNPDEWLIAIKVEELTEEDLKV
jgi:hypothetical protein